MSLKLILLQISIADVIDDDASPYPVFIFQFSVPLTQID